MGSLFRGFSWYQDLRIIILISTMTMWPWHFNHASEDMRIGYKFSGYVDRISNFVLHLIRLATLFIIWNSLSVWISLASSSFFMAMRGFTTQISQSMMKIGERRPPIDLNQSHFIYGISQNI
jgi:hypothetical protein